MRSLIIAVPLALLAGCVSPGSPPPPPVAATPAPLPVPPPAVAASSDWRDWPLTPGDWTYRPAEYGRSVASFGTKAGGAVFEIICDTRARAITLSVGGSPEARPVTIRTTSVTRTLPTAAMTHADGWPPITHDAQLAVTDPLLDAMGFSRGRFVVQQAGGNTLVLPAWAEILRVTEDCRG